MNRQRNTRTGLLALFLLLWASVALAGGGSDYAIPWSVLSSGGVPVAAGIYTLESTLGQAAAGPIQAGGLALCVGYQCDPPGMAPPGPRVFLPIVLKTE
jgi:hypothetical protein